MASVNKLKGALLVTLSINSILSTNACFAGPGEKPKSPVAKPGQTKSIKPAPVKTTAKEAATKSPAKAANQEAPKEKLTYDGKPVLSPSGYFGAAAMGYASAKAAPEVMARLFCYCGCDMSDNHSFLIDCFTSDHGRDCHICQEEAVLALRLYRDGATMSEIQQRVDQDFSKHYPFEEPTAAYKKYKETRLWTKADGQAASASRPPAGPEPATTGSAAKQPKVKEGFSVGNCCGDHDQKKK